MFDTPILCNFIYYVEGRNIFKMFNLNSKLKHLAVADDHT
jgi:hypothetical protein